MGTLVAKAYSTSLFANQADHTYVECGTANKSWKCWGGDQGGQELRRGPGSTKRANEIAQPDEKANIKCYLVNGVCHQAANRILLPAGITVRGARGYSISEALFGTYGRVGFWPCKSPFNQYSDVTGDFPACAEPTIPGQSNIVSLSDENKRDMQYIKGVLDIYGETEKLVDTQTFTPIDAEAIHIRLFMYMAAFHLGPMLDKSLSIKIEQLRGDTEKKRLQLEEAYSREEISIHIFAEAFNKITDVFQDEMANIMTHEQYETLFDMKPGEKVVLADQSVIESIAGGHFAPM